MSRFRSLYDAPSKLDLFHEERAKTLTCEPGGEVDVPDMFDHVVASLCPRWVKVEAKAAEPKVEAKPAPQHPQKGGK